MRLHYRILNVFTVGDDPFPGNPLCVFEDSTILVSRTLREVGRGTFEI